MKTHWLFGQGPDKVLNFAREIEAEHAMKPERQEVESCTTCPFSSDGTTGNGDWHCHGEYTQEGWPRVLPLARERPPDWCPLRKAPRLIVLVPLADKAYGD